MQRIKIIGTNFYWKIDQELKQIELPTGDTIYLYYIDRDNPKIHIGKRSAAGLYCYDCKCSLIGDSSNSDINGGYIKSRDHCPKCNKKPIFLQENFHNSAKVELGFSKPSNKKLTGIQTTSSFSWAQNKEKVVEAYKIKSKEKIIVDGYNDEYTGKEFLDMLEYNCPLQFSETIGRYFS